MQAACKIEYTFNWFFIDSEQIAYFNSGINPCARRAPIPTADPGKREHEWQDWCRRRRRCSRAGRSTRRTSTRATNISAQEPCASHPQTVDQELDHELEQQAGAGLPRLGRRVLLRAGLSFDARSTSGSEPRIEGKRKMSLAEAGRRDGGRRHRRPARRRGPAAGARGDRQAATQAAGQGRRETLRAWQASGAHRRDRDANGVYDDAEAVRIMDAWWPRWVEAQFKPKLGEQAVRRDPAVIGASRRARPVGLGVLRRLVRLRRQGPANGARREGPRALLAQLLRRRRARQVPRAALVKSLSRRCAHTSDAELYPAAPCEGGDAQWCHDAVSTPRPERSPSRDPLDRPPDLPAGRPDRGVGRPPSYAGADGRSNGSQPAELRRHSQPARLATARGAEAAARLRPGLSGCVLHRDRGERRAARGFAARVRPLTTVVRDHGRAGARGLRASEPELSRARTAWRAL